MEFRYNLVRIYPKGADIQLSKWFHLKEYEDPSTDADNHYTLLNPQLVDLMDELRALYGKPITITSGFRTQAKNREIKGANKSFHTIGYACDWTCSDLQLDYNKMVNKIKEWRNNGLLRYLGGFGIYRSRGFIHFDVRDRQTTDEVVMWEK